MQLLPVIVVATRYWSTEVRQRINSTYSYFSAGIGMTAVSAYVASRAQSVMRFMLTRPILVHITDTFPSPIITCLLLSQSGVTFLVGAMGSSILCMSIPYTTEMLPAKIATFAVFSSVMGATMAPSLTVVHSCIGTSHLGHKLQ